MLFVVFVPLLVVIISIIIKKSYPLFYKVQSKLDILNTRLQENLAGKRLVKAFVREKYEEEKFDMANMALTDASVNASRTVSFFNAPYTDTFKRCNNYSPVVRSRPD